MVFLKNINLTWLIIGIVTVILLPVYPAQRSEFVFLIALIFPTFLITYLLNTRGNTRLAGAVFTLSMNIGFYSLFIVIVGELGPYQAFQTEAPVLMLIGLAVLFAGAFVDKWAAPDPGGN